MQERLLQIGAWLKVNGEAIYGTKAGPFWPRRLPWGACTQKPGRLFLHVYGPRTGEIDLFGLKNKIAAAWRLGDAGKAPVTTRATDSGVAVRLPEAMPDEAVNVIVLEIEGEPQVDTTIRQAADGRVVLRAAEAEIHGASPQYESGGGKDNIGYWGNPLSGNAPSKLGG